MSIDKQVPSGWGFEGNEIESTSKLGTTNAQDLVLITNDLTRAILTSDGLFDVDMEVGINMVPLAKHTHAIGKPTTIESGSTFQKIFADRRCGLCRQPPG